MMETNMHCYSAWFSEQQISSHEYINIMVVRRNKWVIIHGAGKEDMD